MSRDCYTYCIGWTENNVSYYGVRYAKNCHPSDLWVTYFTSSKFVKIQREQYGEPDIIQIRKTFGDNPEKAKLWEDKVLRRLDVINKDKWLNKTKNDSFKGTHFAWNDGLTKETCLILLKTSKKISKTRKGQKASEETKQKMKESAEARKHMNSWNQLKNNSNLYDKYESYESFVSDVKKIYEECWKIPLMITKKLNVTEKGVITALKHNNMDCVINQKVSKVFMKYGERFSSYEDYVIKILLLHNKGYTPHQISKGLNINECGVQTLLKSLLISPNKSKTGPSKFGFQEILVADAFEVMSSTQTLEHNTLPQDLAVKLRESICH
jgi:hypothetical protein